MLHLPALSSCYWDTQRITYSREKSRSKLAHYIILITIFVFIIMVLSFWGNVFCASCPNISRSGCGPLQIKENVIGRKMVKTNNTFLYFLTFEHFQYNLEWKHTIWSSDLKDQIVVDPPVLHFKTSQVKYIWVIMRLVSFKWVAAEISCGKEVLSRRISKRGADR